MKLKRIIAAVPRAAIMTALAPLERSLLRSASGATPKAVFIVGPPRSGTTLLYEAMVTRFRFAYFANVAHRFPRTPAAATKLGARAIRNWTGDFQSDYGHIAGWGSPNEGGWIWKRWIPEEHALIEKDAEHRPLQTMRATVAAIAHLLDAPFLNKNVMHSVHMRLLDVVFPGCLFIECRRDAEATARSIVKARLDEFGDDGANQWLSVRPDGWEQFADQPAVTQALAQVMLTQDSIEKDASVIGEHRLCRVSYERLCESPEAVMKSIHQFLSRHGVQPEDRADLPAHFARSKGSPLPEPMEREMTGAHRHWKQSGASIAPPHGVAAAS